MKLIWLEFRRSIYWWGLWSLLLINALAAFIGQPEWTHSWTAASTAMLWPSVYLAPILSALATYTAVERCLNASEIQGNAARRSWILEATTLLAGVATVLLVNLFTVVLAFCVTWPQVREGAGFLRLGLAVITLGYEFLALAIGHIAGRAIARHWVVPVAAILSLTVGITAKGHKEFFFLVAVADIDKRLNPLAVLLPFSVGILALICAVFFHTQHSRATGRRGIRPGIAIVTSAVCAAIILFPGGKIPLFEPRPAVDNPACTTAKPTLCVFPEDPYSLRFAQEAAARIDALPRDTFTIRNEYWQAGLYTADGRGGDNSFDTFVAGNWEISESLGGTIITDSAGICAADNWSDEKSRTYHERFFILNEWLTYRLHAAPRPKGLVTTTDSLIEASNLKEIRSWDDSAQLAWAKEEINFLRSSCD